MTGMPAPDDYAHWLSSLKSQIQGARARAALAVNQELVRLYHRIGTEILERQERQGWGARVIDRLSADLRAAFPDMKGFSSRNLEYMKVFAESCPDLRIGQQPAAQLPWFHLVLLLTKLSDTPEREWYATEVIAHGWSRATLEASIRSRLPERQGAALTNFSRHLPAPHAQLATEALKDPYHFDFLRLSSHRLPDWPLQRAEWMNVEASRTVVDGEGSDAELSGEPSQTIALTTGPTSKPQRTQRTQRRAGSQFLCVPLRPLRPLRFVCLCVVRRRGGVARRG